MNETKLITLPVKSEGTWIHHADGSSLAFVAAMNGTEAERVQKAQFIARAINEHRDWTPVENGLPSENGYYSVTAEYLEKEEIQTLVGEAYFAYKGWMGGTKFQERDALKVTAWRELPEPYKAASDNNN